MESISQRLISLRKKYNFSQSDVARQLGVSPALISAYESHERSPSLDRLIALADIFHVSTDYILGRTNTKNDDVLISVGDLSDNQKKIIRDLVAEFKNH